MSLPRPSPALVRVVGSTLLLLAVPAALAQQAARPADKPPIAQGWIDIATFASPGMPGGMAGMMMGGMGGGAGNTPLSALMGGGKAQGNQFGHTRTGGSGSFVDVTLRTSRNPNLAEAVQAVPAGTKLAPTLQLKVLPQSKPVPEKDGDAVEEPTEMPKGKIKLYWGCGPTVRPGQPKVVDLSTATISQFGDIFKGRRATQRGTHAAPGRPVWPNLQDTRLVPGGRFVRRGACFHRPGRAGELQVHAAAGPGHHAADRVAAVPGRRRNATDLAGTADRTRLFHRGDGRQGR